MGWNACTTYVYSIPFAFLHNSLKKNNNKQLLGTDNNNQKQARKTLFTKRDLRFLVLNTHKVTYDVMYDHVL